MKVWAITSTTSSCLMPVTSMLEFLSAMSPSSSSEAVPGNTI